MSATLITAIVSMMTALTMYTIGVWAERLARLLKPIHLFFFIAGLICDTIGTEMMFSLSHHVFQLNVHSVTGAIALVLMFIHALWAAITLIRNRENELKVFHTFSLFVWIFWLIPFGIGAALHAV